MDMKILIVEDDPDLLEMMGTAFARSGFQVDKTGDVAKAITLLATDDYDILITDKNLPDPEGNKEGGMRLLRYLRRRGNRTEAVMITGYATIDTAIEAMRLGAFDYIAKPFALDALMEKVDRIIEFRKFLNPDSTINSFKEFHNELLSLFGNGDREIDPGTDRSIQSILTKVEQFFRVQKEREKIMIEQRDALAEIASDAEELREKLSEKGIIHELLDKICAVSNRRF